MRKLLAILVLLAGSSSRSSFALQASQNATPPYPPSPVIRDITWQWNTHISAAPGSDQWPVTWAADDNLYLTWGDGGGYGGNNSDGRVSMGVGRIAGTPPAWQGTNVWGGKNPQSAQSAIRGKVNGLLSVGGVLYLWALKQDTWDQTRIVTSSNLGNTWNVGPFILELPLSRFTPLQFGKDYAGARDPNLVYGYFWEGKKIFLARVDKGKIAQRSAYQVVSGFDGSGNPQWSNDLAARQAVVVDPTYDIGWNVQSVYHPVLKRYLVTYFINNKGGWALLDAPNPWGPWTTAAIYDQWRDDKWKFVFSFPRKWMSGDGKTMWMIHSGWPEYDGYHHIKCTLTLATGNTPPSVNLTEPMDGAAFIQGDPITMKAAASDSDGSVTIVEFYRDGAKIGQDTTSPYSFTWNNAGTGTYTLTARATDNSGARSTSAPVTVTVSPPSAQPPAAPTGLAASAASSSRIDLSWTDASSDEAGFRIERATGAGAFSEIVTVAAGTASTSDGGLAENTTYRYRVRAYNGAGNSPYSNIASATTPRSSSGGSGLISNLSPGSYGTDTLDVGKPQYVDRTYTFSGVPSALLNLDYILTANGDKSSQGSGWITFTVSQDVTVYVAHDDRITPKPTWMQGYVDTGEDLLSAGGGTFSVWAKDYLQGTVSLGGNIESGTTSNSMYTVVVGPATGSGTMDTDGDGLTDVDETNLYGTNPQMADTDGDGTDDGTEVAQGTDPLDPLSYPGAPGPGPGPAGKSSGSNGGCGATGAEVLLLLALLGLRRNQLRCK